MKSITCNHCPARGGSGCLIGYETEPIYYFNKKIGWRPSGECVQPGTWEEVMKRRRQQRDSR